jgi:peptidoglycan hydrolase-like protein with peptidoglycan-binding domain
LQKLGYSFSSEEFGTSFFNETCAAINELKKKYNIPVKACYVDKQTADAINQRLTGGLRVNFPIFFGAKSDDVKILQAALASLGFGEVDGPEATDGSFGDATCNGVTKFKKEFQIISNTCYVDETTADKINELINTPLGISFIISGKVLNAFNEPIAGQQVMAYDIDLIGAGYYKKIDTPNGTWFGAGMQKLGEATSDIEGYYEIIFNESDFADAEGDNLPDVVSFVTTNGVIEGRSSLSTKKDFADGTTLANWNIIINNQNIRGESEYAKLHRIVDPFMEKSKLTLNQIADSDDQIEFVASELEQDVFKVTQLVLADLLFQQAPDLKQFLEVDQPLEFLYGLGRQSIKLDWSVLSKTSIVNIANAIQQSHDSNIIFAIDIREISGFAKGLHDAAVKNNLNNSSSVQNGIKNVLSIVTTDDAVMQKFYKTYINRSTSPQEFWNSLREDPSLKDSVAPLLLTNSLSALSGNNATVMQKLAKKTINNDVTSLLTLSIQDWNDAIGTDIPDTVPGATTEEKQNNYRESMRSLLFASYPNEKVSLMVKTQEESGIEDEEVRTSLNKFMDSTKFDLRLNRLMDKPDANSNDTFQTKLEEIAGNKKEDAKNWLNKIQRVFQFSSSPDVMTKLLQKGIDSATMVASMPYTTFKTKYSDVADDPTLLAIHQRASHIVSMIEYTIVSLNRFSQTAKVPAVTGEINY